MRAGDFEFELPPELIAQTPAPRREAARLLVLHRASQTIEHRQFPGLLQYLRSGDVLVLNNSRVIPARLRGTNARTGGQFELLLAEENATNDWWSLLRPGKRARIGTQILIHDLGGNATRIHASVVDTNEEGHRRVRFEGTENILDELLRLGEVPLPPYITRTGLNEREQDRERYQTVYALPPGSVAAPTAGLHFSEGLLEQIRAQGVQVCFVTLHVGLGTFAPLKTENLSQHVMHEERYELGPATAKLINDAKRQGQRVIAVGTTTLRVLESVALAEHPGAPASADPPASRTVAIAAGTGRTRMFIYPPYAFKIVDVLLTNFHLPRSTLLMLVSAFAAPGATSGRELVLSAYAEAVRQRYRFFSYGDAMLVL